MAKKKTDEPAATGGFGLPAGLGEMIGGLAKVKLPGGVVGKVTLALIIICVVIGAVALKAANVWIEAGALGMIFVMAFVILWKLISFADRNPQAALLEGAEFLVHQQIVNVAKNVPSFPAPQLERVEPEAIEGVAADPALAHVPDEAVLLSQPNEGVR
jgi:hypothetical protein